VAALESVEHGRRETLYPLTFLADYRHPFTGMEVEDGDDVVEAAGEQHAVGEPLDVVYLGVRRTHDGLEWLKVNGMRCADRPVSLNAVGERGEERDALVGVGPVRKVTVTVLEVHHVEDARSKQSVPHRFDPLPPRLARDPTPQREHIVGPSVRAALIQVGDHRPALPRLTEYRHKQHRPVGARERDDLLGVAAPGLVALDHVGLPAQVAEVLDTQGHLDAVGSSRAAIFGVSEGGAMAALFAATYPERTTGLILYGSWARSRWAPDYTCGLPFEGRDARIAKLRDGGGTGVLATNFTPSLAADRSFRDRAAAFERMSASPGAVEALLRMNSEIDARHVLGLIRVPPLTLHRTGDRVVSVERGRDLAGRIPGAKYVEMPGDDHAPFAGDQDILIEEIEEFLTGMRHGAEPDRVLSTVLFTDIVDSTAQAARLGDRQWRDLLERHHAVVRRELSAFRGREIDTAGDGFLAAFDGPARAVRAASAIIAKMRPLGLELRAGLHTGECEIIGPKLAGIAIHVGARVVSVAGPGEVLVSQTVKDLVAGSGLRFEERGVQSLKGVPGEWRLYAVA
jgi:class 3 adenylate cyclase